MVREDLTAGSRNWSIVNDPASADGIMAPDNSGYGANNVECDMRRNRRWLPPTGTTHPTRRPRPAYPNAWVRLKRTGNVAGCLYSSNGFQWRTWPAMTRQPTRQASLSNVVYVGICTTAHNNDYPTAYPPPPPCVLQHGRVCRLQLELRADRAHAADGPSVRRQRDCLLDDRQAAIWNPARRSPARV